jgi:hypothetical protein
MWTWIIWLRIKSIENLFPFVPSTALLLLNRVDGWTKLIAFTKQVDKFSFGQYQLLWHILWIFSVCLQEYRSNVSKWNIH